MPAHDQEQTQYFQMLAEMGHTKHIGGLAATKRLIAVCRLQPGSLVLDVGCGVGIGPVYLAKIHGCFVEGVDITPMMLKRARDRAARLAVSEQVAFRVADMHALPFPDNSFDAVIAESVLSFSDQPQVVIQEMARVVKPGRWIAFTEAMWIKLPPPGERDFMAKAGGLSGGLRRHEAWAALMAESGLLTVVAEAHPVTARQEVRDQAARISVTDYLRTFGRFFKTVGNPQYRRIYKEAMGSMPRNIYDHMGYGIYGGRKGSQPALEKLTTLADSRVN